MVRISTTFERQNRASGDAKARGEINGDSEQTGYTETWSP